MTTQTMANSGSRARFYKRQRIEKIKRPAVVPYGFHGSRSITKHFQIRIVSTHGWIGWRNRHATFFCQLCRVLPMRSATQPYHHFGTKVDFCRVQAQNSRCGCARQSRFWHAQICRRAGTGFRSVGNKPAHISPAINFFHHLHVKRATLLLAGIRPHERFHTLNDFHAPQ